LSDDQGDNGQRQKRPGDSFSSGGFHS
jgi:hypothetical protein